MYTSHLMLGSMTQLPHLVLFVFIHYSQIFLFVLFDSFIVHFDIYFYKTVLFFGP